ncbi:MAG: glycosyltransferase [Verrucomicrobia bacterium]|nr:glycosyltransferase [Verrucomicrobiota bacterium]
MRKVLAILFLFVALFAAEEKKTVCLNMIVKNESRVIERCLASVKPLIDYWVIVDTGSTDGTQKIIKKFMKGIPGELHERPWVNFGHNRNEALQLAKNKGDYLLFIDADEELVFTQNFVKPPFVKDSYYIQTHLSGTDYVRLQMINNHLNWKWVGVLHEYLHSDEAKSDEILAGVVNYPRYEGCRSQDPLKFQKDAAVLEEALKREPDNARYVFYLAQSYRDAGESALALKNYERRAAMGGWDQEVFFSKYQICQLQEKLNVDAQKIAKSYLDCYSSRPTRAEPLCRLAQFYRLQGDYLLGYLVASFGLTVPYPKDTLFVESWVYDYGLLLEKSVSAYWIGNFKECLDLSLQLLTVPNLPINVRECVEKNIWWAQSKMNPTPAPQIQAAAHIDIQR